MIPILPILIAWDGAVSNIRTYTKEDLESLLAGIESDDYNWEIGSVKPERGPSKMIYLLGLPVDPAEAA